MNITDVEDKIIRANARIRPVARRIHRVLYAGISRRLRALNIEQPEMIPRATKHIPEMVDLMKRLADTGHTYTSDGSLYYRIAFLPGLRQAFRFET